MLQHGDFFAHPSVAAPTVPRVGFAANEELRDLDAKNVVEFGENQCPSSCCRNRSLGAWSNDSVPRIVVAGTSFTEQIEDDVELILESPGSTQNCARFCHQIARWVRSLLERLVRQNDQTCF